VRIPLLLIKSLEKTEGFDKEAFETVHASGEQVTSIRLNPAKKSQIPNPKFQIPNPKFQIPNPKFQIPWCVNGYYLPERPSFTFDPLFHAGCYYVQEASSMFLEQVLKQTVDLSKPLKVLDLCAAPGGKSTHIQSLISKNSLLVSNEVIRSRVNILKDNIIKWGCENVIVTHNDPKDFSRLEDYFDVIVADAPCSGSGLFRRDPGAIGEWSENNVALCAQRQQRILADAWPALKKGGVLIYSTCSYSREEDEDIMDWISRELKAVSRPLRHDPEWNITETISATGSKGYRFWPYRLKGEGFFLACFIKQDGASDGRLIWEKKQAEPFTKKEKEWIGRWMDTEGLYFTRYLNSVYAWPENLAADFGWLLEKMRVIYSGVLAGELVRDKLIPAHALAMSRRVTATVLRTPLDREKAVKYLQRKDFNPDAAQTGWQLVSYESLLLGWANVLANRVNNYYPKELRILKDG
jgi:16S rRNA C967 or C1407 C5-methylase (RsmB/RsmF family)/NOL1/NOP2/fmu family ribosome biogenesis protein